MVGFTTLAIGGLVSDAVFCAFMSEPTLPQSPNDPFYQNQAGYFDAMKIPAAWGLVGDEGNAEDPILVGVVETFFDLRHPDIRHRIHVNEDDPPNSIDDDENGCFDDTYGANFEITGMCVGIQVLDMEGSTTNNTHGVFVLGVIAAETNNHIGIAGVTGTANIKVVPIVSGSMDKAKFLRILKYLVHRDIRLSNHSYGGEMWDPSDMMVKSIDQYLIDNNHLAIVAGPNAPGYGGMSEDYIFLSDGEILQPTGPTKLPVTCTNDYPCNFSNTLCVGAVKTNPRLPLSHYGPHLIDIMAIGENIWGPLQDLEGAPHGNDIIPNTGTSFATPIVTGVAALMLRRNRELSLTQLKRTLCQTVNRYDEELTDMVKCGGVLDAKAAMQAVISGDVGPKLPVEVGPLQADISHVSAGSDVSIPLVKGQSVGHPGKESAHQQSPLFTQSRPKSAENKPIAGLTG